MPTNTARPRGLLSSLLDLGDQLLATAQRRLELVGVEMQEEKHRLIQTVIWVSAAMVAVLLALLFGSLTLVMVFWEGGRFAVLGGLTAFYSLTALLITFTLRYFIAQKASPFAASLEEIASDRLCIKRMS